MAIKIEDKQVFLTVRDLIPAAQNQQMLSSFPLPQRGALGRQAQSWLQKGRKSRHGLFHTEYVLNRSYTYQDFNFHISGRIDGVYKLPQKAEIEEIKSVILKKKQFSSITPEFYPHFIQQLLLYAYLLQDELEGLEIVPYLVIINLVDYKDKIFPVNYNRLTVESLLFQRFAAIIDEIHLQQNTKKLRESELVKIDFSLSEQRPQQQQMIEAVRHAVHQKEHLMVSAPTGTGKTAAALFPAIEYAYARNKKIIFVTSKGTQQEIVRETLVYLAEQGLKIKPLFLKASRKMCANDIFFCHEAHCRFAKNYKTRLDDSGIIARLLEKTMPPPDEIYNEAVKEELCPFEVNLDLSMHCDILVGDYNYVFDPAAQLRRLFNKKDFRLDFNYR